MLLADHVLTVQIPGPVIGKGRPRFVRATGRAHTPPATLSAENRIGWELRQAYAGPPLDVALALRVLVQVAVPKSSTKKFRERALAGLTAPISKPDLDNIVKLIGDSGNGVVWTDDSRIAEIHVRRQYAEAPSITITIERCAA